MMQKLIYFEFNSQYHPPEVENMNFLDKEWVSINKLSVIYKNNIFHITATKQWIAANIPSLLKENRFFCVLPEEEGICYGTDDVKFLDYNKGVVRK